MCAKIMRNFFCGYDSYLYLCSTKEGVERINKYLRIGTSAFCFGIMQKTVGMKEEIRNILDPASTLSEESVLGLLRHAKKKGSKVWDAALFLLRHNHPDLACSWLREQGDKKLNQLADVLPRLMEVLKIERQASQNKAGSTTTINNHYGDNLFNNGASQYGAIVMKLTPKTEI